MDLEDLPIAVDEEGLACEDFYGLVGAGDYFGELALLQNQPKPMSAWCLTNCHLLSFSKKSLDNVKKMV